MKSDQPSSNEDDFQHPDDRPSPAFFVPPAGPTSGSAPATPGPPPLLRLGGPKAFASYKAEFNRLYRSGVIVDALGRRVAFNGDSCHHVCFKPKGDDPYFRKPRTEWIEERAERIPWIGLALATPTEIRPDRQMPDRRQACLLRLPARPTEGLAEQFFYVAIALQDAPEIVQFLTAFPCDRKYWSNARQGGACLFPLKKAGREKAK